MDAQGSPTGASALLPRRARLLLLTFGATLAGVALALTGGESATADEDAGLLGSIVDVVNAVEAPLAHTLTTVTDTTADGITDVLSATVRAVSPPVAQVTDPIVTGVSQPVVGTVTEVVSAKPITAVTNTVVTTTETILGSVPVVDEVVESLPPLIITPSPAVPAPDTSEPVRTPQAMPEPPLEHITEGTFEVPKAQMQMQMQMQMQESAAAPKPGTQPGTGALVQAVADGQPSPQHPSSSSAVPGPGSAASGASSGSTHAAEVLGHGATRLAAGLANAPADETAPSTPSFDTDSRPD